jgi:hypothetical protein
MKNRYDYHGQGKRFILLLVSLLGLTAIVYIAAHKVWTPESQAPCLCKMVRIAGNGRVVVLEPDVMDWYIGKAKASPIMEELVKHSGQISELINDLRRIAGTVRQRAGTQGITALDGWGAQIEDADFAKLLTSLNTIRTWETKYQEGLGLREINEFEEKLARIIRLREEQDDLAQALAPPVISSLFWTTPTWAMIEVLCWALFGVVTNLIVNAAENLRQNRFRPVERWVALTKISYGPILSMVLVMAIINGWLDVGYETRSWTLPLISFIFGYATRKTALAIDRVLEKLFGRTNESIERGPQDILGQRKLWIQNILASQRVESLSELREGANSAAREIVVNKVLSKETHI